MERIREDGTDKVRWKKEGGGSLRLQIDGRPRIIKPGETFTASPRDIPLAFRDVIILLDKAKLEEVPRPTPVKVLYKVQPRGKSKSLFDVVDTQGKLVNDKNKPLRKDIAEQLVKDLEK
jgi:hypothetical protein